MISSGIHYRVQMFQARRNHLVCCEPMARGPMVPYSFPGLLENTWPGMLQWSTLVLHHTCHRQQSQQVLQRSRLQFASLKNMHCCLQPMCLSPLPPKLWACNCIVLYCIFVYSQTWVTRRTHLQ